jgi:diaminopimelate decarboxylase
MKDFESRDGMMMIGGVSAAEIADEFGTPVYVTEEEAIRKNYRRVCNAFAAHMDTRIHYACKANSSLAILRILESEGSRIDAVSIGEVLTCIKAGFSPDRILYTGTNVSNAELRELVSAEVNINIDSESELERLGRISTDVPISIRITPDVGSGHSGKVVTGSKGSKFGIPFDRVVKAYGRAKEMGFPIKGIHAHIGSGGPHTDPFIEAADALIGKVLDIKEGLGIDLEFIDIGGGMNIPYRPNEPETDIEELAATITGMITDNTDVRTIAVEPGRYIVADTTVLLTRCVDIKYVGMKNYLGVDAGFNTLIRPAFYDSYHHIAVANRFGRACEFKYDVVGPICESGDHLARDRALPMPEEGDIIAVYDAGAYGFSMSSRYNSRPRCREVLVNGGKAELIRDSETIEDEWKHQIIPERLIRR